MSGNFCSCGNQCSNGWGIGLLLLAIIVVAVFWF